MRVNVAGVVLKNPVLVASGTFGYGREYAGFLDLNLLGGIMVKGVSLDPWTGNPPPRVLETPGGMLNSIGLQNPGVDWFLAEGLPWLRQFDTAVIVNVIGRTVAEYRAVAARLEGTPGIAALELNISCPNIKEGGLYFGRAPDTAAALVRVVRGETGLPLIVKLSPNTADIAAMARAVAEAGAGAISAINTLVGMAIDLARARPSFANTFAGLSGPAIKPVALAAVWQTARAVGIPVIGMGGIASGRDAAEFLMAGATAVAVGTALFVDPLAPVRVLESLEQVVAERNLTGVGALVGAAWPEHGGIRAEHSGGGGGVAP